MHEMAVVHSIVDVVVQQAEEIGASEVRSVHLTIGQGRDIVEKYMGPLFAYLARGTIAENAVLHIDRPPISIRCDECDLVFPPEIASGKAPSCPRCSSGNYKLFSGLELTIDGIEVDGNPAK